MAKDLKTAVFCWGRFNPPTIGHGKLLDALISVAKRKGGRNSDTFVLVSHSVDPEKNPLTKEQKVYYLKKMFPKQMKYYDVELNKKKLFLRLIAIILNKYYDRLIMVVGSDRVREFQTELDKFNGATGDDAPLKGTSYSFKEIEVVSAGERDPDAEGVSGMSASKMRAAAVDGDLKSFKGGVPRGFGAKNTMNMMNDVRKGMGLEVIQPTESLLTFKQYILKEVKFQKVTVKDKSGKSHTHGAVRIRPGDTHVAIMHYDAQPATNLSPAVKAHTNLSFGSEKSLEKQISHAKKKFGLKKVEIQKIDKKYL